MTREDPTKSILHKGEKPTTERPTSFDGKPRPKTENEQWIMQFFKCDHLPEPLRMYAQSCQILATEMVNNLQSSPELTAGLRKLLEAKDCFVRAKLSEKS